MGRGGRRGFRKNKKNHGQQGYQSSPNACLEQHRYMSVCTYVSRCVSVAVFVCGTSPECPIIRSRSYFTERGSQGADGGSMYTTKSPHRFPPAPPIWTVWFLSRGHTTGEAERLLNKCTHAGGDGVDDQHGIREVLLFCP